MERKFYIVVTSDSQCFGVRAENEQQAIEEIKPVSMAECVWVRLFDDILERNTNVIRNYIDFMDMTDCLDYGYEGTT